MNKSFIVGVILLLLLAASSAAVFLHNKRTVPIAVPEPVATSTTKLLSTATFLCQNNQKLVANFYDIEPMIASTSESGAPIPTGSVALTLSDGQTVTLPQTISADGARYASTDETLIFWNKGNGVLLYENSTENNYKGCVRLSDNADLPAAYVSPDATFTLRLPALGSSTGGYVVNDTYTRKMATGTPVSGITFTVPVSMATGTNLSKDSFISVLHRTTDSCEAAEFLDEGVSSTVLVDKGTSYSFASSSDAGAGNRYTEIVYALPDSSPCFAVRYFIHTTAIENYPASTTKSFDTDSLIAVFDTIRQSLILN